MSIRNRKNDSNGRLDENNFDSTQGFFPNFREEDKLSDNISVVHSEEEYDFQQEEEEVNLQVEIEDIFVKEAYSLLSEAEVDRRKHFPRNLCKRQMDDPTIELLGKKVYEAREKRQLKRRFDGITEHEKRIAKMRQPLPSEIEVKTFETFFCLLYVLLSKVEESEICVEAVQARASVYISCAALEAAHLLHNFVKLHEEVLEKIETPKQKRHLGRTRQWRMNGNAVQRKLGACLEGYTAVSFTEQKAIFEEMNYKTMEDGRHPLSCLDNLIKLFLQLNSRSAVVANRFYSSGDEAHFQLIEEIDLEFICVCKEELNVHLNLIALTLKKAVQITEKLGEDAFLSLSPEEVLEQLDEEELNFLSPCILPNVKFIDEKLVDKYSISLVGYLASKEESFSALLTKKNFLKHLELKILS